MNWTREFWTFRPLRERLRDRERGREEGGGEADASATTTDYVFLPTFLLLKPEIPRALHTYALSIYK